MHIIFLYFSLFAQENKLINVDCDPEKKACAEKIHIVFNQTLDLDKSEYKIDSKGFRVQIFDSPMFIKAKNQKVIFMSDFFKISGIKKIYHKVSGLFTTNVEAEETDYAKVHSCQLTWATNRQKESQLPRTLIGREIPIQQVEVSHQFSGEEGNYKFSEVTVSFQLPIEVGFYEEAEIKCLSKEKKIDIMEIQKEFADEITFLGEFKKSESAN
ncbi:MAG: hypothetical protein JNM93_06565 [Bacteriovoracaceae bacterium]|nr:hypothetical protein [Bacteriovoracaceae bacterium]